MKDITSILNNVSLTYALFIVIFLLIYIAFIKKSLPKNKNSKEKSTSL